MNYDTFKRLWTSALDEAGLLFPFDRPEEAIDLDRMDRSYSVLLGITGPGPAEPFSVTCTLSWRWDALQSARSATTEEDLLTELHGRDDAADMDTERRWLRVDIKLRAGLPWAEPRQLPGKATWKRWVKEVARQVAPLFPVREIDFNDGRAVLGWCGQPTAEVRCDDDGRLKLTGVELAAYQPVLLPRKWDDPEREPDEDPDEDLAAFAARVKGAMERWVEAVKVLRIVDVSVP